VAVAGRAGGTSVTIIGIIFGPANTYIHADRP
jgi:hypothetical protein